MIKHLCGLFILVLHIFFFIHSAHAQFEQNNRLDQQQHQLHEKDQPAWPKVFKSEKGIFTLTLTPLKPVKLRKLQTWVLNIESTQTGASIHNARVTMDGGMPSHGHGLPSKPNITPSRKKGAFIIEGLKFSMGGEWLLSFNISSAQFDRADIVFDLPH